MSPTRFPLGDADLCVKCGLCLLHCPTYQETRHEADSPRGRIALMQALTTGLVPVTPSAERHLDGCLGCRSCEPVCPAHVPYGELIDAGRAWLAEQQPQRSRRARWMGEVLSNIRLRNIFGSLLWLYQRMGLSTLLRRSARFRSSRLGRMESLLPPIHFPRALPATSKDHGASTKRIQLFLGCTGLLADRDAAIAMKRLLEAAGCQVEVPKDQQCCGALHLHAGLPEPALSLLRRNATALSSSAPVTTLASGCAMGLRDACAQAGATGKVLAGKVVDPWITLARAENLRFASLPIRIAVQRPCTQQLVLGSVEAMLQLLRRIPQLEVLELKPTHGCCGAAGSYFVTEAAMADRLIDAHLAAVAQIEVDLVVSANIGCRLHIAAGLQRRGLTTRTVHPAVLLADRLVCP